MNNEELKNLLNDPKKLLDLLSLAHRLLHVYEAEQIKKQFNSQPGTQEKMGLSDSLNIQLNNQEVKNGI